jgi:hypothetical protein
MDVEKIQREMRARAEERIDRIAGPVDAYRVPDARCRGLSIRVAPDGGKTWPTTYRIKGGDVTGHSLGHYKDIGLEAARRRRRRGS